MNTLPCPDNWESCDFCGARPYQTCRNPDVVTRTTAEPEETGGLPSEPRLPGLSRGAVEAILHAREGAVPQVDRPTAGPTELAPRCLVGLIGHKGAGKDTAAEVYGQYGYVNLKFAEPLKAMLAVLLSLAGDDQETVYRRLDGDLKEVPCEALRGQTPRFAMQTLGTEWGRDTIGQDIWTNLLKMRARKEDMVVVTDVRFPNEVECLHEMGGKVIEVYRPGNDVDLSHSSEQFVFEYDAVFTHVNEGSREEFQDSVEDDINTWSLND